MIGDPVALTIRRKFERPEAAILKAFRGAPSGFVTDAHNGQGCLDHHIKPIDSRMLQEALDQLEPRIRPRLRKTDA